VSAYDYAEIWLHEGFATYSEALFLEYAYGKEKYYEHLREYSYMITDKYPQIGPYDLNFWHMEDGDVYIKGSLMLHTLREIIADDTLFFDIIKTFYQENKYSIATTEDFINLVNNKTGEDFSWFFKRYLYRNETPQLHVSVEPLADGENATLSYKWANVEDGFALPVTMFISGEEKTLIPTTEVQSFQIKVDDRVRVNPWLLLYRVREVEVL
jgi:aminopeptidase N